MDLEDPELSGSNSVLFLIRICKEHGPVEVCKEPPQEYSKESFKDFSLIMAFFKELSEEI